MLDTELREQLLQGYYEKRRSTERLPSELEEKYPEEELIRISKQLDEKNHINLNLNTSEDGTVVLWDAEITAEGVEYIEGKEEGAGPDVEIRNSQNIQVGSRNVQIVQSAFQEIVEKINDKNASEQEKQEAKSRLAQFLRHPLVVSIVGDLIKQIPELHQYLPE
jgi:hypothetical protein